MRLSPFPDTFIFFIFCIHPLFESSYFHMFHPLSSAFYEIFLADVYSIPVFSNEEHTLSRYFHNIRLVTWNILYFSILLRTKIPTEFPVFQRVGSTTKASGRMLLSALGHQQNTGPSGRSWGSDTSRFIFPTKRRGWAEFLWLEQLEQIGCQVL